MEETVLYYVSKKLLKETIVGNGRILWFEEAIKENYWKKLSYIMFVLKETMGGNCLISWLEETMEGNYWRKRSYIVVERNY